MLCKINVNKLLRIVYLAIEINRFWLFLRQIIFVVFNSSLRRAILTGCTRILIQIHSTQLAALLIALYRTPH